MKAILKCIVLIVCIISCSNEEVIVITEQEPEYKIQYLKKTIKDDIDYEYFEYYSNNSLKNFFRSDPDGNFRYQHQFEYHDSVTIEYRYDAVENELLGTRNYYWTEDSVGIVDVVALNGEIAYTYSYEYNNSCGNTKQTFESFDVHTEYIDTNCSSIKVVNFFSGNNTYTEEYIRSDKRSVAIDIPTNCFGKRQLNAATDYLMHREESNSTYSYSSVFKLNEYGNIIEETRTISNGETEVFKYEYY